MTELTELWQQIQTALLQRMARATYDTVIQLARPVSFVDGDASEYPEGCVLTISSPANEWLEHRLDDLVTRAASDAAGRPVRVVYVNDLPPQVEPAPAVVEIEDLPMAFDPRKRAWAKHPLVVSRIYPAYFVRAAGRVVGSTCVPFWRHLCDRFDMSRIGDHLDWTPSAPYILGRLASALACPVTHLAGRLRTCHHFDQALLETGEIIPCCGQFQGAQMGQTPQGRPCGGRPACHYRTAGALEVLAGEGWLAVRRQWKERHTFDVQALRFPPLPTPAQMELLPELQDEFYQFLRDYGHDPDEWRQGRLSGRGLNGLVRSLNSANWLSNGDDGFFLAANWQPRG